MKKLIKLVLCCALLLSGCMLDNGSTQTPKNERENAAKTAQHFENHKMYSGFTSYGSYVIVHRFELDGLQCVANDEFKQIECDWSKQR